MVIGVTGSLASGKSEVARILQTQGAHVLDADLAAKEVIRKGKPVYRAVLKLFGREYLAPNGQIDRKKLARHVFDEPKELDKLNTLIHPAVIVDFIREIYSAKRRKGVLVLDVPLLFESKMRNLADVTVVVSARLPVMIARAKKKGVPENLARKILSSQWPLKKKERLADFVIQNNGSKPELKKKVLEVLAKIKSNHNRLS
ncbi:MAG: dephospho-CoA kinase [Omnitrophica bacterium RIFCSPHIGHO2_02_FULL_51_18]|nr:MAG: dephospho-CoA kinase [Omnitrophica bacterium RIFCSPHIGHO2_02_FULL_51_18]